LHGFTLHGEHVLKAATGEVVGSLVEKLEERVLKKVRGTGT
jgi:hypothetical protein